MFLHLYNIKYSHYIMAVFDESKFRKEFNNVLKSLSIEKIKY